MQPDADRPMSEPYPLQLLGGITQELTSRNYAVLLLSMQALDSGMGAAADGVILLGQGSNDAAVNKVARMRLPFVVWGARHASRRDSGDSGGVVVVGSDNLHGGACVGERFAQLGRKQVLFLGDVSHAEVLDRRQGLEKTLRRHGVKVSTLCPSAFTFGAGFTAVQGYLLRAHAPPDALFAASDLLAMGAVRAFSDAGLRVPDDVAVIGYDDSPSAQTFAPPLSSVHQDWRHGGVLLARKVLDLVDGRLAHSEVMPTSLVVRST
jgi:DNA-binding LacI/PurR family transcriptional regulator